MTLSTACGEVVADAARLCRSAWSVLRLPSRFRDRVALFVSCAFAAAGNPAAAQAAASALAGFAEQSRRSSANLAAVTAMAFGGAVCTAAEITDGQGCGWADFRVAAAAQPGSASAGLLRPVRCQGSMLPKDRISKTGIFNENPYEEFSVKSMIPFKAIFL